MAAFGAGVAASLAAFIAVRGGGTSVFEAFAVVGATQTVVTIGVVAWLGRAPGRELLGFRFAAIDVGGLLVGAGLEVVAGILIYLVVELVFGGHAPVQSVVRIADQADGLGTTVAVVAVTVVAVPLAEELVFRGVLQRALEHRFKRAVALFGTAAIFALTHVALDIDAAIAVPALFGLGLVLGLLVQRTGRLGPAIFTHAGFNLVGVLLLLLS